MDFDLDDHQVMLGDAAARFLREEYSPVRRMAAIRSEAGHDPDIWARFAEFGWLGLPISEEMGGLDGGAIDIMVLMEAFGAALVAEPYVGSVVLAGRLLDAVGNTAQRKRILPDLVAGKHILAFAHAEPEGRFALHRVATTARPVDGGYVITGHKTMVLDGAGADSLLVLARTDGAIDARDGLSLFLINRQAGFQAVPYRNVDGFRTADLVFDNIHVEADALVGTAGAALIPVEEAMAVATLATCASMVGAMGACNRITIDYLKTREQFGVAIGTFQALQHRVVDMTMAYELAKSLMIAAAIKMQEQAPDRLAMVSAAKARCGQSGHFVGTNAVQLHGGIGMSEEYVIGHYLKHLVASDIRFGNAGWHRARATAA